MSICGWPCLRSQFYFFDWNSFFFFTVFVFTSSKYEIYFIIYAFTHRYKLLIFQKLPYYDQKQMRVFISTLFFKCINFLVTPLCVPRM